MPHPQDPAGAAPAIQRLPPLASHHPRCVRAAAAGELSSHAAHQQHADPALPPAHCMHAACVQVRSAHACRPLDQDPRFCSAAPDWVNSCCGVRRNTTGLADLTIRQGGARTIRRQLALAALPLPLTPAALCLSLPAIEPAWSVLCLLAHSCRRASLATALHASSKRSGVAATPSHYSLARRPAPLPALPARPPACRSNRFPGKKPFGGVDRELGYHGVYMWHTAHSWVSGPGCSGGGVLGGSQGCPSGYMTT